MPIYSRSSSKLTLLQPNRDPAFTLLGRPDLVTAHLKRWIDTEKIERSKPLGYGGIAVIATAIGAFTSGALAIGRPAIRHIAIERAKFKSLEIQDLGLTRLRVVGPQTELWERWGTIIRYVEKKTCEFAARIAGFPSTIGAGFAEHTARIVN